MRRSVGVCAAATAAVALGACGRTTPLDFRGHSRPAPRIDVSVNLGAQAMTISPRSFGGGPVEFNIVNGGSRSQRFTVRGSRGRPIASSPVIAPGTNAQVTAELPRGDYQAYSHGVTDAGATEHSLLLRVGRVRSGNDALLQP